MTRRPSCRRRLATMQKVSPRGSMVRVDPPWPRPCGDRRLKCDRRSLAGPRRGERDRRTLQQPGDEASALRLAEDEASGLEEGHEIAVAEQAGLAVEVRFRALPVPGVCEKAGEGAEKDEGADDETGERGERQGGCGGVGTGEVACDVAFEAGVGGEEKEGDCGARNGADRLEDEEGCGERGGGDHEVKGGSRADALSGEEPEERRGGGGKVEGGADHRLARWGRRMAERRETLPVTSAVTRPAPSSPAAGEAPIHCRMTRSRVSMSLKALFISVQAITV